ncbi:hypothetical protein V6N12_064140 [Hibiscus sabdariffa]|uniref:Reverse transcriptase zinc-binding domain-containing protein n=1 Tax=Hibiscus sabdariffa TaxID=183260 RepID=A0ABR2G5V9_9ROSI
MYLGEFEFLFWLALRNGLMTNVERVCRNLSSFWMSQICNDDEEDVGHVFLKCNTTRKLWTSVIKLDRLLVFHDLSFHEWMTTNLHMLGNFRIAPANWNVLFSVICWMLWKRKYSLVMDTSFIEKEDLLRYCMLFMRHVIKAQESRLIAVIYS